MYSQYIILIGIKISKKLLLLFIQLWNIITHLYNYHRITIEARNSNHPSRVIALDAKACSSFKSAVKLIKEQTPII